MDILTGRFSKYMEINPAINFRIIIPQTSDMTESKLSMRNTMSISMPTDIKKRPLKLSLNGIIIEVAS
jgi:hypothetical protein